MLDGTVTSSDSIDRDNSPSVNHAQQPCLSMDQTRSGSEQPHYACNYSPEHEGPSRIHYMFGTSRMSPSYTLCLVCAALTILNNCLQVLLQADRHSDLPSTRPAFLSPVERWALALPGL